MKKIHRKQNPVMTAAKLLLIASAAVYPLFMTMLTGIGILSKSDSYGSKITFCGAALVLSGASLTAAAILCLFRKSLPNLLSMCIALPSFAVCMISLFLLVSHAESAGWTGHGFYSAVPVADMYRQRILPVILPFMLTITIAAVQYFSSSAAEERREFRRRKEAEKNAPAPKIINS